MKQCHGNIDYHSSFPSGIALEGLRRQERRNLLDAALLDFRGVKRNGNRKQIDGSIDNTSSGGVCGKGVPIP